MFRIRIHRIHKFLGLLDPDPDLLISGIDPDPHQNVMDPEHWFLQQNKILNKSYSVADQDLGSGMGFFRIPDTGIYFKVFFPLCCYFWDNLSCWIRIRIQITDPDP